MTHNGPPQYQMGRQYVAMSGACLMRSVLPPLRCPCLRALLHLASTSFCVLALRYNWHQHPSIAKTG
eukprot:941516-Rhodomonas_salina.1